MRPVVITQTGAGQSAPVPLDLYIAPFAVSVSTAVTGTVAYSVEYTYDDPFNPPSGGLNWIADTNIPVGTTTGKVTSYGPAPIRAVRINQASGAGSVTMTVNQAGLVT